MGTLEKKRLTNVYQDAGRPEKLPWHHDGPPQMLVEAVQARASAGRVLDVGCGAGVYAVWLARLGYEVTGLDFVPEALAMARTRAEAAGVKVELVESDVLAYSPKHQFDLVLDCGCLHVLARRERSIYRERLASWLAPHADYVLVHFGRRHMLDWWPVGPRRRTPGQIRTFLGDGFKLRAYLEERALHRRPRPLTPEVVLGSYWFTLRA